MDYNGQLLEVKKELAFIEAWKTQTTKPVPHLKEVKSILRDCKTVADAKYQGVQNARAFELDFNEEATS